MESVCRFRPTPLGTGRFDLHNLLHVVTLRVDRWAQWEIREFADVIAPVAKRVAALTCEAWVDYGLKSRWLDVGGARRAGAAAGATGGGDRRA